MTPPTKSNTPRTNNLIDRCWNTLHRKEELIEVVGNEFRQLETELQQLSKDYQKVNTAYSLAKEREERRREVLEKCARAFVSLSIASCNCCSKTNVSSFHSVDCHYRIADEALTLAQQELERTKA